MSTAIELANEFGKKCGVVYNLSDEDKLIRESIEKKFDIDYVAQFADAICRAKCTDIEWVRQQLIGGNISNANFTSFGNLAYIAKHYANAILDTSGCATIAELKTKYRVMVATVMTSPEQFITKQQSSYQEILKRFVNTKKPDTRLPKEKLHDTISKLRRNRLTKVARTTVEERKLNVPHRVPASRPAPPAQQPSP